MISLNVWIIIRVYQNQAHRRDAEIAEGNCFMENREMPILHKPRAFGQQAPRKGAESFLFVPVEPEQTKK